MVPDELQFDRSRLTAAIAAFAANGKRGGPAVLQYVAKGFMGRVVSLTPPCRGSADATAKKMGERAVLRDLDIIFEALDPNEWQAFYDEAGSLRLVPTTRNGNPNTRRGATVLDYVHFLSRGEMKAFHQSMRTRDNGGVKRVQRTNLIGRKKSDSNHTAFVTTADLKWYNKEAIKAVGRLGAGWNKAAAEVGYRPPAWIARHGTGNGEFVVSVNDEEMFLLIGNKVPFAGRVKGLARSVQTALDWQSEALEKQVASFAERTAKAAGFA